MQIVSMAITTAFLSMQCVFGEDVSSTFGIIGHGKQFKNFGKISSFQADSKIHCGLECLTHGNKCGSFSLTETNLCTISVLRFSPDTVEEASELFTQKEGTDVYGRISGDFMHHGNVAVKETAKYSYLLSLNIATWYEALEICQQFGDGFFLANIDDADELDSLRPWLTGLANWVFVSGTDENHEDCWVWAAPIITKLTKDMVWGPSEPNFFYHENCLAMFEIYSWNFGDLWCDYRSEYLCKRAANQTTNSFPTAKQAHSTSIC